MALPSPNGTKPDVTAALQAHAATQSDWWQQIDDAVAAAHDNLQKQAGNNGPGNAATGNAPSAGNNPPA